MVMVNVTTMMMMTIILDGNPFQQREKWLTEYPNTDGVDKKLVITK